MSSVTTYYVLDFTHNSYKADLEDAVRLWGLALKPYDELHPLNVRLAEVMDTPKNDFNVNSAVAFFRKEINGNCNIPCLTWISSMEQVLRKIKDVYNNNNRNDQKRSTLESK
jgi:hypothetical protein